jgi:hypothetical protein
MKGQALIGGLEKSHNDCGPQRLIGTHTASACFTFEDFPFVEVLQGRRTDVRKSVNDLADGPDGHCLGFRKAICGFRLDF